jgi:hypothetical protein
VDIAFGQCFLLMSGDPRRTTNLATNGFGSFDRGVVLRMSMMADRHRQGREMSGTLAFRFDRSRLTSSKLMHIIHRHHL